MLNDQINEAFSSEYDAPAGDGDNEVAKLDAEIERLRQLLKVKKRKLTAAKLELRAYQERLLIPVAAEPVHRRNSELVASKSVCVYLYVPSLTDDDVDRFICSFSSQILPELEMESINTLIEEDVDLVSAKSLDVILAEVTCDEDEDGMTSDEQWE